MQPDFLFYGPQNELVLVVEVKATKKDDPFWAAKLRRNLIAHGAVPASRYFLLVLPEHAYLWKDAPALDDIVPGFVSDTRQLLKPYLAQFGDDDSRLSESGLELAVHSWLNDVTSSRADAMLTEDEARILADSGLINHIRRGSMVLGDRMWTS